MTIVSTAPRQASLTLTRAEAGVGALLAVSSGIAILGYVYWSVPMAFSVTFGAVPAACLLTWTIVAGRRRERFHAFARVGILGASYGLLATLVYDIVRPIIREAFDFRFNPFGAMPVFGSLITGLPPSHVLSISLGWVYHFWNGIGFAMGFAYLFPRGGITIGVVYALGLQGLMMAAYPELVGVRLDDPGFLTMSIVGHALWGAVLGGALRRASLRS